MLEDNIHVCAKLRNFNSGDQYLSFSNSDYRPHDSFWIEKLPAETLEQLRKELKYWSPFHSDQYVLCKWYYVGRGKSGSILPDNSRAFFYPLFRLLKLFKPGNLILPSIFTTYKDKFREMPFHGDSDGIGKDNLYIMNASDVEAFEAFRKEMKGYLTNLDFLEMPYRKKHSMFDDVDMRCNFALHILLKGSIENRNPYILIKRLLDCTIALESLYLTKNIRSKGEKLTSRVNNLLNDNDCDIQYFYNMRNDIVHASFLDDTQYHYLKANISRYENVLRKSILAFYDLNKNIPTKEEVLTVLDQAQSNADTKRQIQDSLKILKLAR
jgi:hypothetical protein